MFHVKYIRIYIPIVVFFLGGAIVITDLSLGFLTSQEAVLQMLQVLVVGCACYYLPSLLRIFKRKIENSGKRRELRFLKKLFVLCGSIKPVDYVRVMKALISRAHYYKAGLQGIADVYRKSNVVKEDYFSTLISEEKDIDARLFYEKLDIAANYDFDQAVTGIAGDFEQEKREYSRRVKKKTEFIHIIGVTGLFIAMTVMMLYMLQPWLSSLDMSGF